MTEHHDRARHEAFERRVHTDLPRIMPADMVTSQDVTPPPDPDGGRDTERDFMLRYAAL